jgi:hypothetical protein
MEYEVLIMLHDVPVVESEEPWKCIHFRQVSV